MSHVLQTIPHAESKDVSAAGFIVQETVCLFIEVLEMVMWLTLFAKVGTWGQEMTHQ
ncbi:hypothetical protein GI364_18665 [Alicyclobacillus sp. SO9]|nr:hypothetical protein GI364_18665 [Alicyclobacillus sp. SO9]